MLKFLVRSFIIFLALFICLGFSSAILSIPFISAIIFVCVWVFVKSFSEIFFELGIFALIYDFLISNHIGVYFFIILFFAFIFDFLKRFVFEISGNRIFLAYFSIILLVFSIILIYFFQSKNLNFIFLIKQIFNYTLISIFYFYFFSKTIFRLEKIIYFYTQRIDIKRHI